MPFLDFLAKVVNPDVVDQLKNGQPIRGRPDRHALSQWDYAFDQIVHTGRRARRAGGGRMGNSTGHTSAASRNRPVDPLIRGIHAFSEFLDQTNSLDLVNAVRGRGVSPQLKQRLRNLSGNDIVSSDIDQGVDLYRLLLKLLVDSEVESYKQNRKDLIDAAAAFQNLLKTQIESVFRHLLSKTELEDPEAVAFFHSTNSGTANTLNTNTNTNNNVNVPLADILEPDAPLKDLTTATLAVTAEHVAEGGYAKVWKTLVLRTPNQPEEVAVKVFKIYETTSDEARQKINLRIREEVNIWKHLRHPNVIPLLGLTHGFQGSPFPALVCPWMENGTLHRYLEERQREDEAEGEGILGRKERVRLASDVCDGLFYLHTLKSVIHRDLSSNNILIDENGVARISDYGMSRIVSEFPDQPTTRVAGTSLWAAPELIIFDEDDDDSEDSSSGGSQKAGPPITKACDVYSVGCIIFEIFSNQLPYAGLARERTELMKYLGKSFARPGQSTSPFLTDDIWETVQKCTRHEAVKRPDITQVRQAIRRAQEA